MSQDTLLMWRNGEFVREDEFHIGPKSYSLHYGFGVFEGIRAYWSDKNNQLYVFRLEEHMKRFLRGMRALAIPESYNVEKLCAATLELLRRNSYTKSVYIRPLAYVATEQIGVSPEGLDYAVMILTQPMGVYKSSENGLRVHISKWQKFRDTMLPPGVKITGAYAAPALALFEAHRSGLDDALFLNDQGCITEAATANLFVLRNGGTLHDENPSAYARGEDEPILLTPPASDGILRGITRDSAIQIARGLGMKVEERSMRPSELWYADEVFLTGTAYEIAPIIEVDYRPIGDGKVGECSSRLRRAYAEIAHNEVGKTEWKLPAYHILSQFSKSWTTPVYI